MAKTKEISVTYSRTVNIGNYESIRIELGSTLTLDGKDDPAKVRDEAFKQIRGEVSSIAKSIKEKVKAK